MKKAIKVRLKLRKQALFRDTERCIFCGRNGTTHEHVYPRWSHKYMLPRTNAKNGTTIQLRYYNRIETAYFKIPPMRDWQPKCVCAKCNNGWMSDIETKLEPIMAPLIQGKRASLSDAAKEAIALWAIIKVMVVHHRVTQAKQRRELMKRQKPPSHWAVWIATYKRKAWKSEFVSGMS